MGIAIIMDVVYNHFGPSDVDLWQFDGWSENDKGRYLLLQRSSIWYSHGETPDPIMVRPEVRQYIRDNAIDVD